MLMTYGVTQKSKANFILKPKTEVKMALQLKTFPAPFKSSNS